MPYASASLKVSAQIAALDPEGFDLSALKDYFYGVLDDSKETREREIIALYGLASLGEPVLQDLGEEEFQKDLTVKEQLYLVLALNKLGNEQPARKVLKELLKKHGEELGATMRVNSGSDKDDVVEITALAALASSRLMLDEANRLYQYVVDNQPKDDLIYLEQILFLKENLPKLTKEEASFSYSTGGRQQAVKLVPGKTYSLMLTPEKLKKLTFGDIQGSIGIICQYQGSYNTPEKSSTDGVVIKREYKVSGQPTRHFKPQDLIEVSISWKIGGKAPDGIYRISDYLPAGLKLIEKPYNRDVVKDNLGWPVEVNGQKIVFLVSDKGSLHYYARVVNGGIYTAQGMMIQHTKNGKYIM